MQETSEQKPAAPAPSGRGMEDKAFIVLIVVISLAFGMVLWPFYGAVLWAVVIAILFMPVCRRLTHVLHGRRTLAALATVLIVVLIVILPLALFAASLLQQAAGVYGRIQTGDIDFRRYFYEIFDLLPDWASGLLERFGVSSFPDALERLSSALLRGSQILAQRAIAIGQNTFEFLIRLFLMLYLLFFLLRDGEMLTRRIRAAIPLRETERQTVLSKFAVVIRATVKGNIVVAIVQGALGGLIFWILGINAPLLWAVLMAFLSLLPAVGPPIVWLPVAGYLIATGSVWEGIVLIAFGTLVIGVVDNMLRPILVGSDTKMPDYVVLISTLGGIATFGLNGFVVGPLIAALFIAVWDLFTGARMEARTRKDESPPP